MSKKKLKPLSAKAAERFTKVHRLLKGAHLRVPTARIAEELECTERVVWRVVEDMRIHLRAPIEYSREFPAGYYYSDAAFHADGIGWATSDELVSLLALQEQLKHSYPGFLNGMLDPVRSMLDNMLQGQGISVDNHWRFRILPFAARHPGPFLGTVARAVLQRQSLFVDYLSRDDGKRSQREISPQRLVNYRWNWYLDAWCHVRNALRTFSVECIQSLDALNAVAIDCPEAELDRELGSGYGIFSGEPTAVAILKFTARRARWVSAEQWHPNEKCYFLETGEFIREVPYSRSEEIVLDVMRYGADVKVLAPASLQQEVANRHRAAGAQYP